MRLIDADALIASTKDWYCKNCDNYNFVRCRACHIDDMLNSLDEAPTVGGWISVKDRLPMLIEPVLFIGKNYHGGWFLAQRGYYDGTFWYSDRVGTVYATTPVTHWMPLPEPPEEVSGDG